MRCSPKQQIHIAAGGFTSSEPREWTCVLSPSWFRAAHHPWAAARPSLTETPHPALRATFPSRGRLSTGSFSGRCGPPQGEGFWGRLNSYLERMVSAPQLNYIKLLTPNSSLLTPNSSPPIPSSAFHPRQTSIPGVRPARRRRDIFVPAHRGNRFRTA